MVTLWDGSPTDWIVEGAFENGDCGKFLTIQLAADDGKRLLRIGLGESHKYTPLRVRRALAKAIRTIVDFGGGAVLLDSVSFTGSLGNDALFAMAEAGVLAGFLRENWKKRHNEAAVKLYIKADAAADIHITEASTLAKWICFARNLVNEPANRLTPEVMAKRMESAAALCGVEAEVFNEQQIEALGMQAFLNVGSSSANPPRLIVLRYNGGCKGADPVALVGKGVTCDTGGYSLKPSSSMRGIRGDMAGAAAVCGCLLALAENRIPVNAVAVIPAAENRISPWSYIPGDVIGSMAGKSIEIGNTDAEGRLILADAITYAIECEGVDRIVDIATLTGAVVDMLGFTTAGLMSNDEDFCAVFQKAAEKACEQYWRLPHFEEYEHMIESQVADLCNISSNGCGTITAGLFLRAFCEDHPWIHLDIAGTAWVDITKWEYQSQGATGAGIAALYHLCKSLGEESGILHNSHPVA